MNRRRLLAGTIIVGALAIWAGRHFFRPATLPPKPRTAAQVMQVLQGRISAKFASIFDKAGLAFPPPSFQLLALKEEKRLELHAPDESGKLRLVHVWPILAASGIAGPKLREGDRQVPEGFYRFELLNPNSSFHLSLRVNYPNQEDISRAQEEGRGLENLGGDIMVHGGAASIGCLAIGDPGIEELFVLSAMTGLDNINLLILPWDFRRHPTRPASDEAPAWTHPLYQRLKVAVQDLTGPAR